ncbi:MAG: hypothetical protein ACI4YB_08800 [Oscillospiraceae bacterium]
MQEITKEQYVQSVNDYEKLYLITIENNEVYLKADIERGGDIELRVEIMDFKLDTSLTFWKACGECRCRYPGGIYFIEYDTYEEAQLNVIDDFLNLSPNSIFLFCEDNELQEVAEKYNNQSVYVLTK